MKSLIVIMLILGTMGSAEAMPKNTDKAAHFGLAFASQTTCEVMAQKIRGKRSWVNSVGCGVLLSGAGVAKELTDPSRGGNKEAGDIIANTAGIVSAGIILQWGF